MQEFRYLVNALIRIFTSLNSKYGDKKLQPAYVRIQK
ncbi:hypothetical protein AHMF7616_00736 [Adhaeribacter pallidiroseus]|uniref:Uncharacterized protein n=1 Tax=Adhaeribacter pallidiroseus TaxID=2072847 RepID=A0A369QEZ8_9BACT|nr:hypothetical protein AHMF7616_00736 [Adhaeribacter pallidiroseus]